MKRPLASLPLMVLLLAALPSCVVALGNRGPRLHVHDHCPACAEQMRGHEDTAESAPPAEPGVLEEAGPAEQAAAAPRTAPVSVAGSAIARH